jgi:hypothetical protein
MNELPHRPGVEYRHMGRRVPKVAVAAVNVNI